MHVVLARERTSIDQTKMDWLLADHKEAKRNVRHGALFHTCWLLYPNGDVGVGCSHLTKTLVKKKSITLAMEHNFYRRF